MCNLAPFLLNMDPHAGQKKKKNCRDLCSNVVPILRVNKDSEEISETALTHRDKTQNKCMLNVAEMNHIESNQSCGELNHVWLFCIVSYNMCLAKNAY